MSTIKTVASGFAWRRSRWAHICPVALKEGKIIPGMPEFSVGYVISTPDDIIVKCELLNRSKLCFCSYTAVSGTSYTSSHLRRPTRSLSQTLEHIYFLQCPDLLAGFPSLDPLKQGRAPCVNFLHSTTMWWCLIWTH